MNGPIAAAVILIAVGGMLAVIGALVGKKKMVSLLHDYHYRNVKKEDVPAYAAGIGTGLAVMGGCFVLSGAVLAFGGSLWWVFLPAGFLAGLVIMHRAQMRYNGSWLS